MYICDPQMATLLNSPEMYFNRELSWLQFNSRVLEEAIDKSNPLLERLKFISIFSSNLDEFFMIRVAGIAEQIHANIQEVPEDGFTATDQLLRISKITHDLVQQHNQTLMNIILPELKDFGIRIRKFHTLKPSQKENLKRYFKETVFPVLTPLAVDPAHPFPSLRNLGLNLLVELRVPGSRGECLRAVVPVPQLLNRFIPLPGKKTDDFLLLEDLIRENLDYLFLDMKVIGAWPFRITRNTDLDLSEAEADDLLKLIERELRKRRLGTVIRLELSNEMPEGSKQFLKEATRLQDNQVYEMEGYLDQAAFIFFMNLDHPELKDPEFTPAYKSAFSTQESKFSAMRKGDILFFHPYDSFHPVVEWIQEASRDPKVLAIKQTLYRTSGKSPIVQALKEAVGYGKQVTALIELKARFDEETNIVWAKELERSGVNVIYGILGLKTHCKLCMVVRQEENEIRRYVHMSTGNYNVRTSRVYTDMGLMTCNPEFGKDASDLFNYLTGYSRQKNWRKLFVAPVNLRDNLSRLIKACIKSHAPERPSYIRMVMNSLVDPEMIRLLYRASMAGIKVDLVVRGICCLRPGVVGISENIHVRSIVGRFLEHSRVFIFKYGGEQKIYLGSADLMQRNLNRRVEIAFPIEDPKHIQQILEITDIQLKDNQKARILQPDGSYLRLKSSPTEKPINSQSLFLASALERQRKIDTIL